MARNPTFARAFTMIELLVAIAVIAILISIAYPVYTGILERGKATQDMNNLRQIGIATQTYMNDNDGLLFSTAVGAGNWMAQLHPKYLASWSIFRSPFDNAVGTRATPEDDTNSAVSYGLNGNSIIGTVADKISNPSVFVLFAPAQASTTPVTFQGTAGTAAPGVTVFKALSNPGGTAVGGTHSSRKRINALCADLHSESMLWSVFTNNPAGSDPSAAQRWTP
ncbi:MAG: type II secretion system protein [Verrucomicrobia bacterium]|nr:type II secretion system protein [Verrucomicrobiota bacterium]